MRKNVKTLLQTVCDAAQIAAYEGRYSDAAAHYEHAARLYDVEYRMTGHARWSEAVRYMRSSVDRYTKLSA